jgi:hypothetical protein
MKIGQPSSGISVLALFGAVVEILEFEEVVFA